MKKCLSMLVAICLLATSLPLSAVAAALPFRDVPTTAWYLEGVQYVYDEEIMSGKSNTTFEPEANLQRAEMCQILYNLEGKPAVRGSYFGDVSRSDWYFNAVNWAYEEEIVSGVGNNRFDPESSVTREQMVRILFNYAQYKGYDTSDRASLSRFTDAGRISSYAYSAVQWAVGQGILSGTSNTTVSPSGTAIRAQVATVLMKFMKGLQPEEPDTEPVNSVEYEIQKKDHSYRDGDGKVLIEAYYDLVVLQGEGQAIQTINASIEKDYQTYVSTTEEAIEGAKNDPYLKPGGGYHTTSDAVVTHNDDGVISIYFSTSWMMGGVHNFNNYAMTFDLNTGKKLTLPDLFPDIDKESLSSSVKKQVKAYLSANSDRNWWDNAEEIVDDYSIDKMAFCLNKGKITVFFDTYELAPGASGPVVVELSLTFPQ